MDKEKILANIRHHTNAKGLTPSPQEPPFGKAQEPRSSSRQDNEHATKAPNKFGVPNETGNPSLNSTHYPLPTTRSLIEQFKQIVASVGGECIDYRGLTSDDLLRSNESSAGLTPLDRQDKNNPPLNPKTSNLNPAQSTHYALPTTHSKPSLSHIESHIRHHYYADKDAEILHAHFGVAENGACWIVHRPDDDRTRYTLPEHIAIILPHDAIMPTMHEAYERIAKIGIDDLGIFLSGPSKTADIEQSLVLGAQGAITTKVFLV